jgi:hypothetical protein
MRILLVNGIEGSTVSASNASLSYPAANVYHEFLRRRFKSLLSSDTLVIDLPDAVEMDSFFMAFHNVILGTVSFFDAGLAPIGTPIDLTNAVDILVSYFDTISVKRITVAVQSNPADQVYIGGIGAGLAVEIPGMVLAGYEFSIEEATVISRSPGGQTSRNKAQALRARKFTFPNLNQGYKDAIDPQIVDLGIGKPVYVDFFEDDTAGFDPVIYAMVSDPRGLTNPQIGRYDLQLMLREAQ